MLNCLLFIVIVFSALAAMAAPVFLYYRKGWFTIVFHDLLKWHLPKPYGMTCDRFGRIGECKFCNRRIAENIRGDWYTF